MRAVLAAAILLLHAIYGALAEAKKGSSAPLLALKASLDSDPPALSSWVEGSEPCTWRGISCDGTGSVIRM